jgi:uncharacterized protein (DUF924 family)
MMGQGEQADQILAFWFSEPLPPQGFAKDLAFDRAAAATLPWVDAAGDWHRT